MISPASGERLLQARATVFLTDRRTFATRARMAPAVVPTARLLLIERGAADYHLDGHLTTVQAGDLLLVPAMARRWWQASGAGAFAMAWVEFLLAERGPLDLPARCLRLGKADFAAALALWVRLAEAGRRGGQAGRLMQEAELRALLARVLLDPRSRTLSVAAGASAAGPSADGAVRSALDWLERHYATATPERGLARRVGLSDGHFRARFRASVGASPRAFVLELRLHAARRLLAAGTLSVKQVAATVGYRDPLLFSRLYRRRWGIPPSRDLG